MSEVNALNGEFNCVDGDKKVTISLDMLRSGKGPYLLYAVASFLNIETGRPEISVISNCDDFNAGKSDMFSMSSLCAEHVAAIMATMVKDFNLSIEQLMDDVSRFAMTTMMVNVTSLEGGG